MTTNPRSVLVAGATGYLGGYVAREFKNRGYYVRALGRDSSRNLTRSPPSTDPGGSFP